MIAAVRHPNDARSLGATRLLAFETSAALLVLVSFQVVCGPLVLYHAEPLITARLYRDVAAHLANSFVVRAETQADAQAAIAAVYDDVQALLPSDASLLLVQGNAAVAHAGPCADPSGLPEAALLLAKPSLLRPSAPMAFCPAPVRVLSAARFRFHGSEQLLALVGTPSLRTYLSSFRGVRTAVWFQFPSILFLLCGGICFFAVLHNALLAHVRHIASQMRAFARGDRAVRIDPGSYPEFSELATAFNEMADEESRRLLQIEDSHRERIEVMADLMHDLQTPMTAIEGALLLAREGARAPDFSLLQSSLTSHERLAANLKELAELSAAQPVTRFTTVELTDVVREVIAQAEIAAVMKEIRIVFDPATAEAHVSADRDLLVRAVGNLVSNAVRYTQPHGTVEVSIGRDDHGCCISVSDSGAGISPEDLPQILQRAFRTATATRQAPQGAGLGLAIVERIVSMHGGTIHCTSELGKGSRFTITLSRGSPNADASRECAVPKPPAAPEPPNLRGHRPSRMLIITAYFINSFAAALCAIAFTTSALPWVSALISLAALAALLEMVCKAYRSAAKPIIWPPLALSFGLGIGIVLCAGGPEMVAFGTEIATFSATLAILVYRPLVQVLLMITAGVVGMALWGGQSLHQTGVIIGCSIGLALAVATWGCDRSKSFHKLGIRPAAMAGLFFCATVPIHLGALYYFQFYAQRRSILGDAPRVVEHLRNAVVQAGGDAERVAGMLAEAALDNPQYEYYSWKDGQPIAVTDPGFMHPLFATTAPPQGYTEMPGPLFGVTRFRGALAFSEFTEGGSNWLVGIHGSSALYGRIAARVLAPNMAAFGTLTCFSAVVLLTLIPRRAERVIARRFELLHSGITRFRQQDYSQPIELDTHDEFGEVASVLNTLAGELPRLGREASEQIANQQLTLAVWTHHIRTFVDRMRASIPPPAAKWPCDTTTALLALTAEQRHVAEIAFTMLRIELGIFHPIMETISLLDLCDEEIEIARAATVEHDVQLGVTGAPESLLINTDAGQLVRILRFLLRFASRSATVGSTIDVNLAPTLSGVALDLSFHRKLPMDASVFDVFGAEAEFYRAALRSLWSTLGGDVRFACDRSGSCAIRFELGRAHELRTEETR